MSRYVTFVGHGTIPQTGLLTGELVRTVGDGTLGDRLIAGLSLELQPGTLTRRLDEVQLLAPIPRPPSVRDFFAFEQHVAAAYRLRDRDVDAAWYEMPVFYFTNPAAIFGPGAPVPVAPGSRDLDYELEIAAVIGRGGRNIPVERAWDHVLGLTILNDWTARDLQRKEMTVNLGPAKGKDFATSLGPFVVSIDELAGRFVDDRHDLAMTASVNGHLFSRGNARDLYWTFPQMIERASRGTWLRPGDVIGSGTVGTGCILELRPENTGGWLKPGDVVELAIEALGVLRNALVGEDLAYESG